MGSWGYLVVFSFYFMKNLGVLGDGGVVIINDEVLVEKVLILC